MSNFNLFSVGRGYTDDANGYSFAYSWFRNRSNRWVVCCHEHSFSVDVMCLAVTDDFGNLVRAA